MQCISYPHLRYAESEVVSAGRQRPRGQLHPRLLHPRREPLLEGLPGLLQRVARLPLQRLADPVVGQGAARTVVLGADSVSLRVEEYLNKV